MTSFTDGCFACKRGVTDVFGFGVSPQCSDCPENINPPTPSTMEAKQ